MKRAVIAIGALFLLGCAALAAGPHTRVDILEFASQLVAGSGSTVNLSAASSVTIPAGAIAAGSLTPGTNGQCVITNGGSMWGSCAGTAGEQTLVFHNAAAVSPGTVSGNTVLAQTLDAIATGAGYFNNATRLAQIKASGDFLPGGGTGTGNGVNLYVSFNDGTNTRTQTVGTFLSPANTATHQWYIDVECYTSTTGAAGRITCYGNSQINELTGSATGGQPYAVSGNAPLAGTIDLTQAVSVLTQVSFGTASTSNVGHVYSNSLRQKQ